MRFRLGLVLVVSGVVGCGGGTKIGGTNPGHLPEAGGGDDAANRKEGGGGKAGTKEAGSRVEAGAIDGTTGTNEAGHAADASGDTGTTVCPYLSTDTVDHDGDGWAPADGDCNDCNKYVNPGAYDIPGDGIDQDCDGVPDDEPTGCDGTVAVASPETDAGTDGVKAIDLCRTTTATPPLAQKTWGVLSAAYVLPDGTSTPENPGSMYTGSYTCTYASATGAGSPFNLGFGILGPTFGTLNTPQQGARMLGLSSGSARAPDQTGYENVSGYDKCFVSGAPTGFPAETPACPGVMFGQPHDGAALQVVLRVPTNAVTMTFDSDFFSFEFPDYVCSAYNDTYVVIMTPNPVGEPTSANGDVAFDSNRNAVSVNSGFLSVCAMNTAAGSAIYPCVEGTAKLAETGFGEDNPESGGESHASTDWLATTVDVRALEGQEVTLLFAIWDSTDGILDSTVLIDNVHWTFATDPNEVLPAAAPPSTTFVNAVSVDAGSAAKDASVDAADGG